MSPRLLALVPIAVALNVAIGRIVAELSLPVYLDTVGTILAAALAGPVAAVAVGVLSQVISGFVGGYIWLAFIPIQVLIAALAVLAARRGGFRSTPLALLWGALVGILAGAASSVISYVVFRGVTASGVTAVTTLLTGFGLRLSTAVVVSSVLTDLLDKTLAFALVGVVLRGLPTRMTARFPAASSALGR